MRLTLDALAVLDAIARRGSFAAAAEELHRVPSAITYTVHKLEQDLDVQVFDRSGHRARLTPVGETLLAEGRHLLRAAGELEALVRRVATGWEAELSIAVSALLPLAPLLPLIEDFDRETPGTRLRLSTEVLGGVWDALVAGRADLAIGASGDGPVGGGYACRVLGTLGFVFVCAPQHPLAASPVPLTEEMILASRAIAIADSSRVLAPRTAALLNGQPVLTVPSLEAKIDAHRAGLGVGYVPRAWVLADLAAGRLVECAVEHPLPGAPLYLAWRTGNGGRALKWFLHALEDRTPWLDWLDRE